QPQNTGTAASNPRNGTTTKTPSANCSIADLRSPPSEIFLIGAAGGWSRADGWVGIATSSTTSVAAGPVGGVTAAPEARWDVQGQRSGWVPEVRPARTP